MSIKEDFDMFPEFKDLHNKYAYDYFLHYQDYYKNILLNLPKGRIYKKAHEEESNFRKLIKTLSHYYELNLNQLSDIFKGLFISQSDSLLEKHMHDLGIPNDIFYKSEDNATDVFVLKYLCKDDTNYNIQRIINAYGVRCYVESLPNNVIYIKFYSGITSTEYTKTRIGGDVYEYTPVYRFFYGQEKRYRKIRFLIDKVKPFYSKLSLNIAPKNEVIEYKKDPLEPDFISLKINNKYVDYLLV